MSADMNGLPSIPGDDSSILPMTKPWPAAREEKIATAFQSGPVRIDPKTSSLVPEDNGCPKEKPQAAPPQTTPDLGDDELLEELHASGLLSDIDAMDEDSLVELFPADIRESGQEASGSTTAAVEEIIFGDDPSADAAHPNDEPLALMNSPVADEISMKGGHDAMADGGATKTSSAITDDTQAHLAPTIPLAGARVGEEISKKRVLSESYEILAHPVAQAHCGRAVRRHSIHGARDFASADWGVPPSSSGLASSMDFSPTPIEQMQKMGQEGQQRPQVTEFEGFEQGIGSPQMVAATMRYPRSLSTDHKANNGDPTMGQIAPAPFHNVTPNRVTSVGGNANPNVVDSMATGVMPAMQQQHMHQADPSIQQQYKPQPAPNHKHMPQSNPINSMQQNQGGSNQTSQDLYNQYHQQNRPSQQQQYNPSNFVDSPLHQGFAIRRRSSMPMTSSFGMAMSSEASELQEIHEQNQRDHGDMFHRQQPQAPNCMWQGETLGKGEQQPQNMGQQQLPPHCMAQSSLPPPQQHDSVGPVMPADPDAMLRKLKSLMSRTSETQKALQEWDKANGLPKSHSQTMVKSARSRKQIQSGQILKKWDGSPLLDFSAGNAAAESAAKGKQRKKMERRMSAPGLCAGSSGGGRIARRHSNTASAPGEGAATNRRNSLQLKRRNSDKSQGGNGSPLFASAPSPRPETGGASSQ